MFVHHLHKPRSRLTSFLLAAFTCAALTACASVNGNSHGVNPGNWLTPFRADVVQGNFVSKEQISALTPGLSRAQTKDLLGTPLVTSLFHEARWDYVFTFKRQGVKPQTYKYAVFFEGDKLSRFEGDAMPTEAEFLTQLDTKRALGNVPALEATPAQLGAFEKPSATVSAGVPLPSAAAPTVYPPLESSQP